MTATLADLHDAVVSSLKDNGRYEQLQSEIRRHLFALLTDPSPAAPSASPDDFLVQELIREYLSFNGYSNSLSVFLRETASPPDPMNRDFLSQALNASAHRHVPLLYSLAPPPGAPRGAPRASPDGGFFEITA
jgi:lisH domain-containing protein FOPNL